MFHQIHCKKCSQKITGKYLVISKHAFHPDCVICKVCQKKIKGPFQINGVHLFHPDCYKKKFGLICDHCKKPLDDHWQVYDHKKYHPTCYQKYIQPRCVICSKEIDGKYVKHQTGPAHVSCYQKKYCPPCDICGKPLVGQIIKDSFGNQAHAFHGSRTPICQTCGRITSARTSNGAYELSDGRTLCGYCEKTAIMTASQAEKILRDVHQSLKKIGLEQIPDCPLILTDKKTINSKAHSSSRSHIKGLAHTTIQTINKVKTKTEYKVYILFGLPEIEFKGVLAHELTHLWLMHHQIKLSPKFTEGLCNLMSALIYSQDQSDLAQQLRENLEKNPDPVYGHGYQRIKKIVREKKWKNLINELLLKKKLNDDLLGRFLN